jgi:hypothetical protein
MHATEFMLSNTHQQQILKIPTPVCHVSDPKKLMQKKQNMFKSCTEGNHKLNTIQNPQSAPQFFQLQRTHPSPTKLHFLLEVLLLLLEICGSTEWYLLLRRQADT